MNLIKNLQAHIDELRSDLEGEPREENGYLLLVVKGSVMADINKYLLVFRKVKDPTSPFKPFFSVYVKTNQSKQVIEAGFKLNLSDVYAAQLKDFFNKDINADEVNKCIAYLSEHGWDTKRFQDELGVSESTAGLIATRKNGSDCIPMEPSAISV